MTYLFSDKTQDLIKFSRQVAISMGYNYISTLHLFIADCLANGDNGIKTIAYKNENEFDVFLEELNLGQIDEQEFENGSIPLTAEAEQAIHDAEIQREYFGQEKIQPCHIFLAALKNKESLLSQQFFNIPNLLFRLIKYYAEEGEIRSAKTQAIIDNTKKNKTQVFISYSHLDRRYLDELKRHFKPLEHLVVFWEDSKIDVGQEWQYEIRKALESAKIAILLISADFFNSEFITTNELPLLLEKAENEGTTIISLILKPCLFEEYPEVNKFQTINNPTQPISSMDETAKELIWVETVRKVKKIISY